MAVASVALTGLSGYMQARGERAEGIAQSNYYNYMANQNEMQAEEALKRGDLQSRLIQDQAKREGKNLKQSQAKLAASQINAMAASGLDISSVSSEDIASSTYDTQREDELALRYNADIKTWENNTDASYKNWAFRTDAEQARYSARNALWASKIKYRNTLLSTATKMVGQAALFGASGAFGGSTSTQGSTGWLKGYGSGTPKNTMDMRSYTAFT